MSVKTTRPLSESQSAVLKFITEAHQSTGAPVPRADVERSAGVDRRHVTGTLASLIGRGAIHVPMVGVAAYLPGHPGPVGRAVEALRSLRDRVEQAGHALPRARTAEEMASMGLSVTVEAPILSRCMTALAELEEMPARTPASRFCPAEVEAAILLAWPVDRDLSPAEFAARVRRQLAGVAHVLDAPPPVVPARDHVWGTGRCLTCGVFRHHTTATHPQWPDTTVYSVGGEHWTTVEPVCYPGQSLLTMTGVVTP